MARAGFGCALEDFVFSLGRSISFFPVDFSRPFAVHCENWEAGKSVKTPAMMHLTDRTSESFSGPSESIATKTDRGRVAHSTQLRAHAHQYQKKRGVGVRTHNLAFRSGGNGKD